MTSETRPAPLTSDSTREEVLADLEWQDQLFADVDEELAKAEWPEVPEGFEGCVWSKCGKFRAHHGRSRLDDDPHLVRQADAGEEDQTAPGWDGGD